MKYCTITFFAIKNCTESDPSTLSARNTFNLCLTYRTIAKATISNPAQTKKEVPGKKFSVCWYITALYKSDDKPAAKLIINAIVEHKVPATKRKISVSIFKLIDSR